MLNPRERELVAIGASLGSNCIPCIKFHIEKGRRTGLSEDELRSAVELADRIRKVPSELVLETARATMDCSAGSVGDRLADGDVDRCPCSEMDG